MTWEKNDPFSERLVSALRSRSQQEAIGYYRGPGAAEWQSAETVLHGALMVARSLRRRGLRQYEPCLVAQVTQGELEAAVIIVGCLLTNNPPLILPPAGIDQASIESIWNRTLAITQSRIVLVASSRTADLAEITTQVSNAGGNDVSIVGYDSLKQDDPRKLASGEGHILEGCRVMQLTSGTTGANRICMWSADAILQSMQGIAQCMKLGADDRFFSWSGLHHTVGIFNSLLLGLFHQIPTMFLSPQQFATAPDLWIKGLSECGATITSASNFAFKLVADLDESVRFADDSLARMRAFWNTGERVTEASLRSFFNRLTNTGLQRSALRANYGLAESTGGATFTDIEAPAPPCERLDRVALEMDGLAVAVDGGEPAGRHIAVMGVGSPRHDLAITIRDEAGNSLADGNIGEIVLQSPSLFIGYCDDQEATKAVKKGDLLFTGDLGYLRGDDLFWVGRRRECIVINGRKIDPSAFAPVVDDVAGLDSRFFAAFGVDDEERGTQKTTVLAEYRSDRIPTKDIVLNLRRAAMSRLGLVVRDIVLLQPNSLLPTISGKQRHRYYKQLYLAGELDSRRLPTDT